MFDGRYLSHAALPTEEQHGLSRESPRHTNWGGATRRDLLLLHHQDAGVRSPTLTPSTRLQFFGAMVVMGLVLVCTAVTMTQKPPWMEGPVHSPSLHSPLPLPCSAAASGSSHAPSCLQEDGLGLESPVGRRSAFEPSDYYTRGQLEKMGVYVDDEGVDGEHGERGGAAHTKEKAEVNEAHEEHVEKEEEGVHYSEVGVPVMVRQEGKLAVEAAAQNPGGMIHRDDFYVAVPGVEAPPKPRLEGDASRFGKHGGVRYSRLRAAGGGEDRRVFVGKVESTMYPFVGIAQAPETPGERLGKHLRSVGAGDGEYVSTTTGGQREYSVAPMDRVGKALMGEEGEGLTYSAYHEQSSHWALYGSGACPPPPSFLPSPPLPGTADPGVMSAVCVSAARMCRVAASADAGSYRPFVEGARLRPPTSAASLHETLPLITPRFSLHPAPTLAATVAITRAACSLTPGVTTFAVFVVLLVVVAVIGYHLVPKGAVENALNMWVEQGGEQSGGPVRGEAPEKWERGFTTRKHPHVVTDTYYVPSEGGVPMRTADLYREDGGGVQMRMV